MKFLLLMWYVASPVLELNPYLPRVRAALGRYGWSSPERKWREKCEAVSRKARI